MLISSFDLEDPSVWNSSLIWTPLWFICKEEGVNNICYHDHLPSLRTADAFPDDRKCVCCSQAITYLALGFSTVNYKKGKYIRPQIEVFTYNFPFTDYNTPCLLEKNCTWSFFVAFDKFKKISFVKNFCLRSFLTKLGLRPVKGLFKIRVGSFEVHDLGNPCRSTL